MDSIHQQAIELKYQGLTHQEISDALGGKLTKGTLDVYFSRDGLLSFPYLEYQAKQNDQRVSEGKDTLKKEALNATQAIVEVMQNARKQGKDTIVLKSAQAILDRAGIPVSKGNEHVKKDEKFSTGEAYEDFIKEMKEKGIDLVTGIRISAIKMFHKDDKSKAELIRKHFDKWFENGILDPEVEIKVEIVRKDPSMNSSEPELSSQQPQEMEHSVLAQ